MLQNDFFKQRYSDTCNYSWSRQNLPEHPLVQNFFAGYICNIVECVTKQNSAIHLMFIVKKTNWNSNKIIKEMKDYVIPIVRCTDLLL